jgi:succinate-semialdehyde dehydrogenase / glutarate-semialdehyde dehydrogenase
MGTRKIGPAIAAGCTMVLKPAPQTPLSIPALADILREAGLPDGVLNVVTTSRAGDVVEPLLRGGRIRKLSFTGSTQVGRLLLAQCADTVVRTSTELGGNAPFIVFDDADLEVAVDRAMTAKMRNMGAACTAANRFLVHRSVVDEFAERLATRMGSLVVGGARAAGPGRFYPPTVLTDVSPDSDLMSPEIFGPVAAILTDEDEDEVVRRANASEWGLVGYVFTRSLDRALRVSERLEIGMVGLNTGLVSDPAAPFGGVKQSGLGREGGRVGIEEFLEYRYVAMPAR